MTNQEILKRVKNNPYYIEIATEQDPAIADNKAVMHEAIKQDGSMVQFASERLKNDPETAKLAVSTVGQSLEYLPEHFKDDLSVVSIAIKTDPNSIYFASDRLKDNYDLALECVSNNPHTFKFLGDKMKNHKMIALTALNLKPNLFDQIGETLKQELILAYGSPEKLIATMKETEANKRDKILSLFKAEGIDFNNQEQAINCLNHTVAPVSNIACYQRMLKEAKTIDNMINLTDRLNQFNQPKQQDNPTFKPS